MHGDYTRVNFKRRHVIQWVGCEGMHTKVGLHRCGAAVRVPEGVLGGYISKGRWVNSGDTREKNR